MLTTSELVYCAAAASLLLFAFAVYAVLTHKLGIARIAHFYCVLFLLVVGGFVVDLEFSDRFLSDVCLTSSSTAYAKSVTRMLGITAVFALVLYAAIDASSSSSIHAKREALLVFCISAATCFGAMTLRVHARLMESGVPTDQLQWREMMIGMAVSKILCSVVVSFAWISAYLSHAFRHVANSTDPFMAVSRPAVGRRYDPPPTLHPRSNPPPQGVGTPNGGAWMGSPAPAIPNGQSPTPTVRTVGTPLTKEGLAPRPRELIQAAARKQQSLQQQYEQEQQQQSQAQTQLRYRQTPTRGAAPDMASPLQQPQPHHGAVHRHPAPPFTPPTTSSSQAHGDVRHLISDDSDSGAEGGVDRGEGGKGDVSQLISSDSDEDAGAGGGEWSKHFDNKVGRSYYYNRSTGQSRWDTPHAKWD